MRNIILVTLDSLRADHCSFMGYHRDTTPTIDRMASKGLVFKNAIAASIGTPASMTCTFTGDYPSVSTFGALPEPWRKLLSKRKTLAQVLSQNGYATGAYNPNVFVSSYFGFNKGFDHYEDFLNLQDTMDSIYHKILDRALKSGRKGFTSSLRNMRNLIKREEVFKPWEDYYPQIIEWVEGCKKPFFLWVLLLDTHHPYLAPSETRQWSSLFSMLYSNWKLQMIKGDARLSEKEKRNLINAYDDSIHYADNFIERLWRDLRDEDPIFVIHSDHGEAFGEHGKYGHGPLLYKEFIHVPLVIYNCDKEGKVVRPVSLTGISPTIMELIGRRNEFPSKSFLEGERDWAISKVFEGGKRKLAIRMKDWKYLTGHKEGYELYHLKEDPYEQVNLIAEYPKLVKVMEEIVRLHIRDEERSRSSEIRL